MRRAAWVGGVAGLCAFAVLGLVATAGAVAAATPDECTGLPVCVSVKGPWVKIPAPTGRAAAAVEYELHCPSARYVIAGTDARVSVSLIAVSFGGASGSPVGPGVTTGHSAVFSATYGGGLPVPTSFRPAIGCVPAAGGGGARSQVSFAGGAAATRSLAVFAPFTGLDRQVVDRALAGGTASVSLACQAGGRLVHTANAVAFRTTEPPSVSVLRSVTVTQRADATSVEATARARRPLPAGVRAELQLQAVCTPGVQ